MANEKVAAGVRPSRAMTNPGAESHMTTILIIVLLVLLLGGGGGYYYTRRGR